MRPFVYARASDARDAVRAAPENAAATRFLAGGTTLLDLMKLDVERPARVVDVSGLARDPELARIEASGRGLHLGAFAHMSDVADHADVQRYFPVVAQSLALAASAQLRNMATLGGNALQRTRCPYFRDTSYAACNKRAPGSGCSALDGFNRLHAVLGVSEGCIASYPGDFAQAMMAIDARVEIAGPGGRREIAFADLHRGPQDPARETTLEPGELITGFKAPAGDYRRSLYLKVRDRQSYAFAAASAAVVLRLGDERRVDGARVALGGVAYRPWRSADAEAALLGKPFSEEVAREAAHVAFADATTHAHNAYKVPLGRATLTRALLEAARMEV